VADPIGHANRKHLAPLAFGNTQQGTSVVQKRLLEGKNALRGQSIKPDAHDFDEVKTDYCRTHHITMAELGARFESNHQLAAELYRLAIAAKLSRLRSRAGASSEARNDPDFPA
jgi:hypothetical protein